MNINLPNWAWFIVAVIVVLVLIWIGNTIGIFKVHGTLGF